MERINYSQILQKGKIEIIKNVVEADGIIIYPTDTLYGIGGNFFSNKVIKKIDHLKQRIDMPYSVIVSGIEMLKPLVADIPESFYGCYRELLPGKFTFLFSVSSFISPELIKGKGKIGIRIPNVPPILELVEILDVPLISTSVNRSGEKAMNDPGVIIQSFKLLENPETPFVLIDAGKLPDSLGSTIIDMSQDPARCLRRGDDFHRFEKMGISFIES